MSVVLFSILLIHEVIQQAVLVNFNFLKKDFEDLKNVARN